MLKKEYRIPPRESFAKAHVFQSPPFLVKMKYQDLSHSRFGIVISKKIDKRAVVRNRIRRLFMSVIENEKLYEKKGYDMLFILKNPVERDRHLIEAGIQNACTKIQSL